MSKQIYGKHWSKGGTGVTNFNKEDRWIYERAIDIYGDPKLEIGSPIGLLVGCTTHLALYYSTHGDLSKFWRIYDDVRKNENPPATNSTTPSTPQPTTCQHEWVKTQGLFRSYEDCKKCGVKKEDS